MSAPAGVWNRDWSEARDETLLEQVRAGDTEAYAELWRRHLPSAYAVASRYRGRASAEDIVGEASLRIYDRIRAGQGPTSTFRSYFLATVKSVAIDLGRSELRLVPTEPEHLEAAGMAVQPYNPALRVDQDLVRVAFGRLSEFDQQVLWRTVVEGVSPTVMGPAMGMSANRVSVAAFRAREALRAQYLDAHAERAVDRAKTDDCRWVLTRMGRYVRGKLRPRQRARVEQHLHGCRHAAVLVMELAEINRGLPALLVPLTFLGGTSTLAIWATAGLGVGYGGASGAQLPITDPSIATAASAQATTTVIVTKAAAVVAAGAISAGLVPAHSLGFDASSGSTRLQAAGLVPRTDPRTGAGSFGLGTLASSSPGEAGKAAVEPTAERAAGVADLGMVSPSVSISQSAAVGDVLTKPPAVAGAPASVADSDATIAPEATPTGGATEPVVAAPQPTAPEPVVPEPVTPQPTAPEPVVPEPVTPQPVAPEPVVEQPAAPEPVAPPPAAPEPVVPEPVTPQPPAPEPVVEQPAPQPVVPEPVTPPPAAPDPVVAQPAPEPVVQEPVPPPPAAPEPVAQPAPEPVVAEPVPPPPAAPDPVVAQPAEPVVAQPAAPEPVAPEPVVAPPAAPEPVVAEPVTPQPAAPEPVVAQPAAPDPVVAEPVQPVTPPPVTPQPTTGTSAPQLATPATGTTAAGPTAAGTTATDTTPTVQSTATP